MERCGEKKVSGGKMLKLKVDVVEDVITRFILTGDFFIHPEEGIELIEAYFKNKKIPETGPEKIALLQELESKLAKKEVQLVGFESADLIRLLLEVMEWPHGE